MEERTYAFTVVLTGFVSDKGHVVTTERFVTECEINGQVKAVNRIEAAEGARSFVAQLTDIDVGPDSDRVEVHNGYWDEAGKYHAV